ncbi:DUF4407 domain-containing protein [Seonamhaeicola sp. ML3]|uniref:DUF4407 domain-containing protein n=1 Tax=Seonamhaeicola sp. ML3 TaxID=2937786 RepID=UPI00200DB767|nr:DUF4407 domain-containing protein [Seonamhaeicola sp. ML3]
MVKRFFEYNKFLWWFAGEDSEILNNCNRDVRVRFSLIGLVVLVVMIATFVSVSYGVYELLESYYIGLLIGVYTSVLVMFLYLFIQYTLTKDVLPHKKGKKIEITTSYLLRFGFIFILGLLASQPIEYYLFSGQIDDLMNEKIVESIHEKSKSLNLDFSLKAREEIKYSKENPKSIITKYKLEKEVALNQFIDYQYSRNFFIEKMILMDRNLIYIWPFSILFVVIFSLPFYLKLRIDFDDNYYRNKTKIQRNLIERTYQQFLLDYNNILKKKYPEFNLQYTTAYKDPPYNTIKIDKPKLGTEQEFTKWLLDEGN